MNELAPRLRPVTEEAPLRPEIENDLKSLLDDVVFDAAERNDFAVKPLKLTASALGDE
jgi:hypothetical protein|tara:strand:- start:19 stop:192 length:174 start_codon:yes stop_codon:yes gene_type:complete